MKLKGAAQFAAGLQRGILMAAGFYASAWSSADCGGVLHYLKTPERTFVRQDFVQLPKAGYLAWSPDRTRLYATCSFGPESDTVAAFAVAQEGKLELLNHLESGGRSCCHVTVSPDGRWVYAVNYGSGSFAEFKVGPDGALAERTQVITHTGSGPVAKRQEKPHPHCVVFTPDGRFLAVADLGIDVVRCYPFDPASGIAADRFVDNAMAPGSGPRHLAFAPDGKIAYLVTELGNTLESFRYADGRFTPVASLPLLPDDNTVPSKAAAVRLTCDGRYLVASNRGYDSLVLVKLDGTGAMTRCQIIPSGGVSPRDLNFVDDDRLVVAGHEATQNLTFFALDRGRDRLLPCGGEIRDVPRPLCILP